MKCPNSALLDQNVEMVFFDAGGTLLHPHPSVGAIYAQVARRHGLRVDAEQMQQAFGVAWKKCHRAEPSGQVSQTSAVTWWRHVVFTTLDALDATMNDRELYFQELYAVFARPEVWRLYPEARKVLDTLSGRGYKLGLISNWDARLRPLLQDLEIADYFCVTTISCEVGAEKPDAAIFRHALKSARIEPASAFHVGDSLRDDVRGARRVGMRAVLLERDHGVAHRGRTIRSLTELL
jgi:putative hydrolase of the HAD superfamily